MVKTSIALLASCAVMVPLVTSCASPDAQSASPTYAANSALTPRSVHAKRSSNSSLLYVVMRQGVVDILSYPQCEKLGTLKSAAHTTAPVVANRTNGRILINVRGSLDEYAHGGQKPIAQIHPTPSYGDAVHYAFDPTSSDIAVSFQSDFGSVSGTVGVYPTPSSQPTVYTVPGMSYPKYLGYDTEGDLFVDGSNDGRANLVLAELAKGTQQFRQLSFDATNLTNMGSIQWDGDYIAVADGNSIYRLQVSGTSAAVAGKTTLVGAWADAPNFWIQDGTALGDHLSRTHLHNGRLLGLWHYPKGGSAYKSVDLSTKRNDTVMSEAVSIDASQ